MTAARDELFNRLWHDRVLAHEILFRHRHPDKTPAFHKDMILGWHSGEKNLCDIAFRGSGKSTIGEEAIILMASFREFRNCLIFGASFDMAAQRLHAIRREFERNRDLRQLFGDQRGQPWADDKIELVSGVVIQAMGRGQSLRGTKEEILRPDMIFGDDIEDRDSVKTEDARDKVQGWFLSDVLPAADPGRRVRVAANALHPQCLALRMKEPGSGFRVRTYPIVHKDKHGNEEATWPARFPLAAVKVIESQYRAMGRIDDYSKEYLCVAEAPELKPFKREMFRVEPAVKTWHGVWMMFDPARTVKAASATTGFAAWSWIANRLVVWDAWGRMLMPDQIVSALFEESERWGPTEVGVEEDGLNEFLLQPIRHEQTKRRVLLPVRAMKAPKGKNDFIRGLQPFFNAREIVFAKELPDLASQLLSFPQGRIDVPNALAYALMMRPGAPVYGDFSGRHVVEGLAAAAGRRAWLCLNGRQGLTTAALCQFEGGVIRFVADWVREGDAAEVLGDIVKEAGLEADGSVLLTCPPQQFDRYANSGIVQAAARIPARVTRGGPPENGRAELAPMLRREVRSQPAVMVSTGAAWTLRAFAGGYALAVPKKGTLASYAEENVYRVLMEGVESFAGMLARSHDDAGGDVRYALSPDGRRYMTTLPGQAPRPLKSDWG